MADYRPLGELRAGELLRRQPAFVVEGKADTTKAGKPYGRFKLRDRSGTYAAVRWDLPPQEGEVGRVVLACGVVDEYRGEVQVKLEGRLEVVERPEEYAKLLTEDIGEEARERWSTALAGVTAERLSLAQARVFEAASGAGFQTVAAAERRHHTARGGLLWHVATMAVHADQVVDAYPGIRADVVVLGVLCHDLGKLDCYDETIGGSVRNVLDKQVGHTAYSIRRVMAAFGRVRAEVEAAGLDVAAAGVDEATELAVVHCVAAHHGRLEWGALAEPQTAEAQLVHCLDLLDSRVRAALDDGEGPRG